MAAYLLFVCSDKQELWITSLLLPGQEEDPFHIDSLLFIEVQTFCLGQDELENCFLFFLTMYLTFFFLVFFLKFK